MKKYSLKEIYYTLQGEGFHSGRPAVFCRFTGCNLWSGREDDRESAICTFCDTDFRGTDGPGGGKYTASELRKQIEKQWPKEGSAFIVFTGGEPALQLDEALIKELKKDNHEIAIETNGTLSLPKGIDWICVSPKADTELSVTKGDELKLVYPQWGLEPSRFEDLDFKYFYLQPKDGPSLALNTEAAIEYCKAQPQWRLSLQTHKYLKIP